MLIRTISNLVLVFPAIPRVDNGFLFLLRWCTALSSEGYDNKVKWSELSLVGERVYGVFGNPSQSKAYHWWHPPSKDPTYDDWLATDYGVTLWLVNSMESNITSDVMFLTLAKKGLSGRRMVIRRIFLEFLRYIRVSFLYSRELRLSRVLHFSTCLYGQVGYSSACYWCLDSQTVSRWFNGGQVPF